jgi:hypothetical protein
MRLSMRKQFDLDQDVLGALTLLAADRGISLERLATEAFLDLLRKHGRPTNLKDALRQSLRSFPVNDNGIRAAKERTR